MSTYTVAPGDTFYGIAYKLAIPRAEFVAANPQVADINVIWPGMVLNVPASAAVSTPSSGVNTYALVGAAAVGLGLLWLFFKDKPRSNPRGKRGKKKLKRMSAVEYAKATIKPHHVLTAYQVGTALARRYR